MRRANDIEQEAGEWLIRLDGQPTEATRTEFDIWVSADLRHRAAYLRLSTAWATTGRLNGLIQPGAPIDADLLKSRNAPMTRLGRWFAVAATAAVASVGMLLWWSAGSSIGVYTTDIGGFSRIALADGSTVSLNTDSKVRVHFGHALREVTLIRGEAHFDVAHDIGRPFDVHAGSTVVRAVGTSFDVRRRDTDEVDVVVTDGNVSVRSVDSAGAGVLGSPQRVIVAAGESATVGTTGLEVKKVDRRYTARHLAWEAGELSFQGESLGEVVKEFNRYSRRHLELADTSLKDMRVGGNFKATDIDSFVVALHTSFGLVGSLDEHGIIQIRRDTVILGATPPGIVDQR